MSSIIEKHVYELSCILKACFLPLKLRENKAVKREYCVSTMLLCSKLAVPCSGIVGSAELREREHELDKTGGKWGEEGRRSSLSLSFSSRPVNFSRVFQFI